MKTPFVFGKLAEGKDFTDRENELKHLTQNFTSGINTILISPRRWGKSSLVKKAGEGVAESNNNIKMVFLDMFNIRSEEEFYKTLSEHILGAVSGKFEELVENSKKFFKKWVPQITFSPDSQQEFSFGLNWKDVKKNPDEILNLAEVIAKEKKIKIVICIDEFQNLSYFENPLAFQKKIRSHWQKHQNTSYCLYGSKRHMLMEFFSSPSMPFYKFGDLILLEKIPTEYWKDFIQKRYRSTGKKISKKQAEKIAALAENHPYYVQQLAQLCWFRTDKAMQDDTIDETIESLVLQLSLLFQNMTESLSSTQVNFIKALIDGAQKLSSKDVIEKYKLGTSANISKIKKALIHKEVIDERIPGKLEILDPIFAIWFRDFYMN
ncbi:ATP-binding protein [Desulfosarcina sp.]|nr:ATP-binding protein [Desulfosarcina sp.]